MKKFIALLLAAMITLCCSMAFAADYTGWWSADNGSSLIFFGEDGMMQRWNVVDGRMKLDHEMYCAVIEEDGAEKLIPFVMVDDIRYVQRFAEREGWMDLTDADGNATSWLNSTPEDVANPGLEVREDMPLVGIWTQMSDDLTAPCFQFYDDGYFDYSDLLGVEESETLFGVYQLENGLLSLYTVDSCFLYRPEINDDGSLTLTDEVDSTDVQQFVPVDISGKIPTAETILGQWENEESSITFNADGSIDMAGITDYGTWSLNGGRLIISSDDPIWSFASYVSFDNEEETILIIEKTDGTLVSQYTKK